jgi:hypothetical protein
MRRIAGGVIAAPASILLGLTMAAIPGGTASCGSDVTVEGQGGASASNAGSGARSDNSTPASVAVYGTGPITSSTSTGGGCDTAVGMDFNSPECLACIECTRAVECQSEWSQCTDGTPCGDFIVCLDACETMCGQDAACYDTCVGTDQETGICVSTGGCMAANAAGCDVYLTALSCSVCMACTGDCDAATNCS